MQRSINKARPALTAVQARFLLNTVYAPRYGRTICLESSRSLRVKLSELEAGMDAHRKNNPTLYQLLVKVCVDYEIIISLHGVLET